MLVSDKIVWMRFVIRKIEMSSTNSSHDILSGLERARKPFIEWSRIRPFEIILSGKIMRRPPIEILK